MVCVRWSQIGPSLVRVTDSPQWLLRLRPGSPRLLLVLTMSRDADRPGPSSGEDSDRPIPPADHCAVGYDVNHLKVAPAFEIGDIDFRVGLRLV